MKAEKNKKTGKLKIKVKKGKTPEIKKKFFDIDSEDREKK